ncbi:MAG: ribosome maturation factor RimM [Bacillota bacterium]|jgi:16S rRNA processing protein RimM
METKLLTIGRIINTRGLQGELKIASLTDFPLLRYRKGKTVFLEKDGQYMPLVVKEAHHQPGLDFVQFQGFSNINLVKGWMNLYLYAPKEEVRLKAGSYFYEDLVGNQVMDESNHQSYGVVLAVESIANRVNLRIQKLDQSTILIPFLDVFIREVNLDKKTLVIRLIEGM